MRASFLSFEDIAVGGATFAKTGMTPSCANGWPSVTQL